MTTIADRTRLAYTPETQWGVTPTTNPALQNINFVSEGFGQDTTTERSRSIRADRQVSGVFRTGVSASGALNVELTKDAYLDFVLGALGSAGWTGTMAVVGSSSNMEVTGGTLTQGSTWTVTPSSNEWIYIEGFTNETNNGWFQVSAASSNQIQVHQTLVDEEATNTVTIHRPQYSNNGVAQPSWTFEREHTDITSGDAKFASYPGMVVDTMQLTAQPGALITAAFNFMGKQEIAAAASVSTASPTAVSSEDVFNTIEHITAIHENEEKAVGILGFTLNTTNNHRARTQLGALTPISYGAGKFEATGTVQMYFATIDVMNRYLQFTTSDLALGLTDPSNLGLHFHLPSVKFNNGRRVAGGENTDIIADMSFTAFRDSTLDYTLRVSHLTPI